MRLFLALPLPEPLKAALGALQADLRSRGIRGSWTDPAALHLTLAFLSEQDPEAVPRVGALLEALGPRHPAFPLATTGLGAFPRPAQARVLWLGLAPEPRLDALVDELRQGLSSLGLAFDPKPFQPHLTLARFRTPVRLPQPLDAPEPRPFEAGQVVLYESVLGHGGARHLEQAAVRLGSDQAIRRSR